MAIGLLLTLAGPALAVVGDEALRTAEPPAAILAELKAAKGGVGPDSSCALVDWMLAPDSKAPASAVEVAGPVSAACGLPAGDVDEAAARKALGGKTVSLTVSGQVATVIARSDAAQAPGLCCSLQGGMTRIGVTAYWVARYRLADIDQAVLMMAPPEMTGPDDFLRFRGPNAPPAPAHKVGKLDGRIAADQVHSEALGETRKIVVYTPKGARPSGGWPILVVADGGAVYEFSRIVEAMIDQGLIAPLVLIGTESGQEGIVEDRSSLGIADLRSADYLHDYEKGGGRFERHMTFVSGELIAFARQTYGVSADPAKVAITGWSNGGDLAFQAALLHPEVFGTAIPMSAGWKPLEAKALLTGSRRARFIVSAGLYETPFMRSTSKSVAALKAAGFDVGFVRYSAGHSIDQWEIAFARALPEVFGPGSARPDPAVTAALAPLAKAMATAKAQEAALSPLGTVSAAEALRRLGRLDQAVRLHIFEVPFASLSCGQRRQVLKGIAELTEPVDGANLAALQQLAPAQGWFKVSEVGQEASDAAFHIVQHGDTAMQQRVAPLLAILAEQGQADPDEVAAMIDRIALSEGRPQTYGTQFTFTDGVEAPYPVADVGAVEARRRALKMSRTYAEEMAAFRARTARAGAAASGDCKV